MTRTFRLGRPEILSATVLLAMTGFSVTEARATPILYFADGESSGSSSGGSGDGGGFGRGSASGGPMGTTGAGFSGIPRTSSEKILSTQPALESSQTKTDATGPVGPGLGAAGYGAGSATGNGVVNGASDVKAPTSVGPVAPSSATGFSQMPSGISTPGVSTDPVTHFFEDLSMDLDEVDQPVGAAAPVLTQAFDVAEVISNVAETPVTTAIEGAAPTLSFGDPASDARLTIYDFVPGSLAETSLSVHMPEPASLFLLGAGLLLTSQYRRLKRRRVSTPLK